jgi:hypothetical protein
MFNVKIEANDDIVIQYLEALWRSSKSNNFYSNERKKRRFDSDDNISNKKSKIIHDYIGNIVDDILNDVINNITKKSKSQLVKHNLSELQKLGFEVYNNIQLEKEVDIHSDSDVDVDNINKFMKGDILTRKDIMKNISKSDIFPKYKSGNVTLPSNFRYLVNHHNTIKILDRIWCYDVITNMKENIPNKNIFISSVTGFSGFNNDDSKNTNYYADINTQSTDNIILLDIMRAYDSLEWDDIKILLLSNLTKKIDRCSANNLLNRYLVIIKNRILYYNGKIVKVEKGIPTGLPSSTLVFLLCIEEIINRWLAKYKFVINKDFILNIYVDDIYIKFICNDNINFIINSLIHELSLYNLNINIHKSKADNKLGLINFSDIKETDCYLGIPFTRDITKYSQIILDEYYKKHLIKLSWSDIYFQLLNENHNSTKFKHLYGYITYKLKPLLKHNNIVFSHDNVLLFIKNNLFNWLDTFVYIFYGLYLYLYNGLLSLM